MILPIAALLSLLPFTLAHGPQTPQEVAEFHARQSAAYHCAPAIALYNAQRKRSWAQKVLGGDPTAHGNLFVDGYFDGDDAAGVAEAEKRVLKKAEQQGKSIMACEPVEESVIRNSTCVLGECLLEREGHAM
jgi:hypothetical protein